MMTADEVMELGRQRAVLRGAIMGFEELFERLDEESDYSFNLGLATSQALMGLGAHIISLGDQSVEAQVKDEFQAAMSTLLTFPSSAEEAGELLTLQIEAMERLEEVLGDVERHARRGLLGDKSEGLLAETSLHALLGK